VNELLIWMSARRSGSTRSFRARVAEIEGTTPRGRQSTAPARLAAWTLSKLGHAEFEESAAVAGWRIAPPVLAATDIYGPPRAVLCGARSTELLSALLSAAGALRLSTSPQTGAPDLIELRAESASVLISIAGQAGIPVQWNASLAILAACPLIRSIPLEERTIPVGAGWTVSRFSKSGLTWVPSSAAAAHSLPAGLFRFRGEHGATYILKQGVKAWSCSPAVGKFRILTRRHRPLNHSAATRELTIAAACRPPELVERALTIASGHLPVFRDNALVYTDVGRITAQTAATILGQRLYERRT
jgi:hypothetical protein